MLFFKENLISLSLLTVSFEFKEFMKSLVPIIKKVIDAIDFKKNSGTKVEIEPPANAPNKLANTKAEADPKKTAKGLFDVPLIVNVAN